MDVITGIRTYAGVPNNDQIRDEFALFVLAFSAEQVGQQISDRKKTDELQIGFNLLCESLFLFVGGSDEKKIIEHAGGYRGADELRNHGPPYCGSIFLPVLFVLIRTTLRVMADSSSIIRNNYIRGP